MAYRSETPLYVTRRRGALLSALAMSALILNVLPACGDDPDTEDEPIEDDSGTTGEDTEGPPPTTETTGTTTSTGPADPTTGGPDPTDPTGSTTDATETAGSDFDCVPDAAELVGEESLQAGINYLFSEAACKVVSGPPRLDQLVIDYDVVGGRFFGSGRGLVVESMEGGMFVNEDGFYTLRNLFPDTVIAITFAEGADNPPFTATFTLSFRGRTPSIIDASASTE